MAVNSRAIRFLLRRYLLSAWIGKNRKRAALVGVLVPILGVSVGVFAFVVVLSVMGGFVTNIKEHLVSMQAHIEIVSLERGKQIISNNSLINTIKQFSSEIISVSPYQSGDVILQSGNKGAMARLEGLEPGSVEKTIGIEKFLSKGISLSILEKKIPSPNIAESSLFPTVLIGLDLMSQLGIKVGDTLTLVSTTPDDGPAGMSPTQFPVVVAGYIRSGSLSINQKRVLSSITVANQFFQTENHWLGLQVKLEHPLEADKISKILNEYLKKYDLRAKPWSEENSALLRALTLEHWGMSFVMLMIVLVGCFSISISLLLSVRRKASEMAILRSMGFELKDLSKLFLWQGFIIGTAGVILGVFFGAIVLYFIHNFQIPFVTTSYSSKPLPVVVSILDISIISIGSILLAMFASVWPAIEVRKLDIIEILTVRN